MIKVGVVHPRDSSTFDGIVLSLDSVKSVQFELASANYDFFFELLSHVEIQVAVVCVEENAAKPFEVMTIIRTTYPDMKVVAVIPAPDERLRDRALDSGAWDVLSLPLSLERLESALQLTED